jgi:hypothetical protein
MYHSNVWQVHEHGEPLRVGAFRVIARNVRESPEPIRLGKDMIYAHDKTGPSVMELAFHAVM